MGKSDKKGMVLEINLPGACPADLRGRQSVRATFKLSTVCIDAIGVVARHLGIKQKSLFDHLAEDMEVLTSIAEKAGSTRLRLENRVQKTFVISRRSLSSLEQVSKNYNTPRDALVEYSVQRLLPLIVNERQRQEARKEMLVAVQKHFHEGIRLQVKWETDMGNEDPFLDRLAAVMRGYERALGEMNDIIEQGRPIEMFEPFLEGGRLKTED